MANLLPHLNGFIASGTPIRFGAPDSAVDPEVLSDASGDSASYSRIVMVGGSSAVTNGTSGAITALSITTNVLTVVAPNDLSVGQKVEFFLMNPATFLNGITVVVKTASGTQFTADFVHANYGPAADAGYAIAYNPLATQAILTQIDPTTESTVSLGQYVVSQVPIPAGSHPLAGGAVFPGGITGIQGTVSVQGTGAITNASGEYGIVGGFFSANVQTSASIPNGIACMLDIGNQGTIDNAYGLYIVKLGDSAGTSTNEYAIYMQQQNGSRPLVTNIWGIYQAGADAGDANWLGPTTFRGLVAINGTTSTNGVPNGLDIEPIQHGPGTDDSTAVYIQTNTTAGGPHPQYGIYIDTPVISGGATIGSSQGMEILDQNPGSVATGAVNGLYIHAQSAAGSSALRMAGHLCSDTGDLAGTITITASTSATHSFATNFANAPTVTITPTSDPTAAGGWWVTATTSGFTVNTTNSTTITFNYHVIGNPN